MKILLIHTKKLDVTHSVVDNLETMIFFFFFFFLIIVVLLEDNKQVLQEKLRFFYCYEVTELLKNSQFKRNYLNILQHSVFLYLYIYIYTHTHIILYIYVCIYIYIILFYIYISIHHIQI